MGSYKTYCVKRKTITEKKVSRYVYIFNKFELCMNLVLQGQGMVKITNHNSINALMKATEPILQCLGTKHHHHHHYHHIFVMQLGHFLTRSSLTYPEASSKVCHNSLGQLGNSVSLPWVIYYEAFYLHLAPNVSCIPVICPELVLFLIPL